MKAENYIAYHYNDDDNISGKFFNAAIAHQNEISFKAGIKEVIEWIKNNAHYNVVKDGYTLDETDWQSKLKSWNING
jgi:hypothetical protein